jgi:hypothetical protein
VSDRLSQRNLAGGFAPGGAAVGTATGGSNLEPGQLFRQNDAHTTGKCEVSAERARPVLVALSARAERRSRAVLKQSHTCRSKPCPYGNDSSRNPRLWSCTLRSIICQFPAPYPPRTSSCSCCTLPRVLATRKSPKTCTREVLARYYRCARLGSAAGLGQAVIVGQSARGRSGWYPILLGGSAMHRRMSLHVAVLLAAPWIALLLGGCTAALPDSLQSVLVNRAVTVAAGGGGADVSFGATTDTPAQE